VSGSRSTTKGIRLGSGERRLLLVVGDVLAAFGGAAVALTLWGNLDYFGPTLAFVRFRAAWFIILPMLWPLFMVNLYDVHAAGSWRVTVRGVLAAAAGGAVAYLIVYFLQEGSLARRGILYFLVSTVAFTLVWRAVYIRVFTSPTFLRRVLVIGAGVGGRALVSIYQGANPKPFLLLGFIDDDVQKKWQAIEGVQVLGSGPDLARVITETGATDLIVAIQGPLNSATFQSLLEAQEHGLVVTRLPVAYEELLGRVPIQHLEADWILRSFVDELHVSGAYLVAKRLVDLGGALLGLGVLLLILPWVALATIVDSGRPVFFRQKRVGKGGHDFELAKLRTMRQDAEKNGIAVWAHDGDPRTTPVGRILRKAHLDEFPQFWSVLRGDMSLVGPRPERPELVSNLEKRIPFYRARLLVKPGITGWAQVNYGKGASLEGSAEKLEYDLYYIKHRSLGLDIRIMLRTLGSVIGLKGV